MYKYFKEMIRILDDSLASIDENKFTELIDDCVKTLRNGGRIVVSGLGKNVPVCDKFVGTLTSFGLEASFMNTNSAVHGDIGMVRKQDLVIILTKSGETAESVYLYNLLKKRDCLTWLLSFSRESTLADALQTKIIVDLEHEGDKWNIVPNNSTTLNLMILQTLAMRIADEMNITINQFKENHPGGHIGVILNGEKE